MIEDTKIYLITCWSDITDQYGIPTGRKELVVSHGIGNNSLRNIVLSNEHPSAFNTKKDSAGIYIEVN